MWLFALFFPEFSISMICRGQGTDISKYFRESRGLRDNESRLYAMYEPGHSISYKMAWTPSKDSDQPAYLLRLIRTFAVRLKTLLTLGYQDGALQIFCSDWADAGYTSNLVGNALPLRLSLRRSFTRAISLYKLMDVYLPIHHTGNTIISVQIMRIIATSSSVNIHRITKTCLYNFDPLKPHFYIVKLGFTGVYIIFLISAQKHRLWYSLEPPRRGGSNEYPQSMFWAEIWKISLFLSENFQFFEVKFSMYLNRRVFVKV